MNQSFSIHLKKRIIFTEVFSLIQDSNNSHQLQQQRQGMTSTYVGCETSPPDYFKLTTVPPAVSSPPAVASISAPMTSILSKQQQLIIETALEEKSVFFTGSGGTGKSFMIALLIEAIKQKFPHKEIAKTAATGIVALNMTGSTLHSFAGVQLGNGTIDENILRVRRNKGAVQRWIETDVLIIDEISMIDAELFNKLDAVARCFRSQRSQDENGNTRHNNRNAHLPFGGMQLLVSGDFMQLPPVSNAYTGPKDFAFSAPCWGELFGPNGENVIELTEVFRQSDKYFIDILNQLRFGKWPEQLMPEFIEKVSRELEPKDGIKPTKLYCTKKEVKGENDRELQMLSEEGSQTYGAVDWGQDEKHREVLKKNSPVPDALELRIGTQVMVAANLDPQRGIMNGTRGVITGFRHIQEIIAAIKKNFTTIAEDAKSTTNKSTKDNHSHISTSSLSSSSSSDKITDKTTDKTSVSTITVFIAGSDAGDKKQKKIHDRMAKIKNTYFPVVRFLDGSERVMTPHEWNIEERRKGKAPASSSSSSSSSNNIKGEKNGDLIAVAGRIQMPLIHAWACTVHKSQGLSLDYVEAYLGQAFECAQAYVALSRARSMEGLRVIGMSKKSVITHPKALQYYKSLQDRKTTDSSSKDDNDDDNDDNDQYLSKRQCSRPVAGSAAALATTTNPPSYSQATKSPPLYSSQ
jgi:ATP-dependent DNA helicase PIF1